MLWYLNQVKRLLGGFHSFMLEQFPRSKNSHVDLLATLATISRENLPKIILVEDYAIPAYDILTSVGVNFMRVGPSWMDPLVAFLKSGILPKDKTMAKRISRKAPYFVYPRIRNYTNTRIWDHTCCVLGHMCFTC